MGLLQSWHDQRLRDSVRYPDLQAFKRHLAKGDLFQEVLDPQGTPGATIPMLHAMVEWPEDGRGAYAKQWVDGDIKVPRDSLFIPKILACMEPGHENDREMFDLLGLRAIELRPLVEYAVSQGVDLTRRDSQGRTLAEVARVAGRESWLSPAPDPTLTQPRMVAG